MRTSPIAGSWYPGDRQELTHLIEQLLKKADLPRIQGSPFGIISPHAGIQFSGQAAAYGFKALQGTGYKRVILLGPSHYMPYHGIATSGVRAYETPLGKIRVDRDVSDALSKHPLFQGPRDAEMPEHSLEMELPFLQAVLDEFAIVPLVVGNLSLKDYDEAAAALKKHIDDQTVVVVSSDFTHYGTRFGYLPFRDDVKNNLAKLDGEAINKITAKDFTGFMAYVEETGATICGVRAIGVFLKMLPPASQGSLLHYYTSGDIIGDYSDAVSYASIMFTR